MQSMSEEKRPLEIQMIIVHSGKPKPKQELESPKVATQVSELEHNLLIPQSRFLPLHHAAILFQQVSNNCKISIQITSIPQIWQATEKIQQRFLYASS